MIAPATDETRIAASDVADARRWSNASSRTSSGTITIPPPTPKSAPKKPPTSPISERASARTRLLYARWIRSPALAAEPGARRALPRRRRRARADRRRGPRTRACPTETRAELARLAGRYAPRRLRHRPAERRRARDRRRRRAALRRRSTASSSSPRRAAWAERIHAFARAAAVADLELKPLTAAFHYRARRRPRSGARASSRRSRRAALGDGLPHALGPHGARGAAAGRRVEGHRGARACSSETRAAARALRGRRHDRPRRLRRARRARGRGARRGRLGRRARPSSASAPTWSSARPKRSSSC